MAAKVQNQVDPAQPTLPPVAAPQSENKVEEVTKPYLLVETKQIVHSEDATRKWDHYSLSLITEKNEKLAIDNAKKYRTISEIVIDDGTNKTVLKAEESFCIGRLIEYFTDDSRKEIDPEKFSYYLQHGKENTYAKSSDVIFKRNFRENIKHHPGEFYSLNAKTDDFGKNGEYKQKDLATHHYMFLTNDVFVSRIGKKDIAFSSHKQIMDAYFPAQFIAGYLKRESY